MADELSREHRMLNRLIGRARRHNDRIDADEARDIMSDLRTKLGPTAPPNAMATYGNSVNDLIRGGPTLQAEAVAGLRTVRQLLVGLDTEIDDESYQRAATPRSLGQTVTHAVDDMILQAFDMKDGPEKQALILGAVEITEETLLMIEAVPENNSGIEADLLQGIQTELRAHLESLRELRGTGLALPRWVFVGGGVGVLGLVLAAGFFLTGGSDDADAVSLPLAAPVETTTSRSTEAMVVDTEAPAAVTADSPDLSTVPLPAAWSYTATKTGDVVPPPEFLTVAPSGTSYPGLLNVDSICGDGNCRYESTYDLEREFLDEAEVGTRSPAAWERNEATWSVLLVAHTMERDDGIDRCVLLHTETWEVTVTEASLVDGQWVAAAFEGNLLRSTGLDPAASTAGCTVWNFADEWSVVGTAMSG